MGAIQKSGDTTTTTYPEETTTTTSPPAATPFTPEQVEDLTKKAAALGAPEGADLVETEDGLAVEYDVLAPETDENAAATRFMSMLSIDNVYLMTYFATAGASRVQLLNLSILDKMGDFPAKVNENYDIIMRSAESCASLDDGTKLLDSFNTIPLEVRTFILKLVATWIEATVKQGNPHGLDFAAVENALACLKKLQTGQVPTADESAGLFTIMNAAQTEAISPEHDAEALANQVSAANQKLEQIQNQASR